MVVFISKPAGFTSPLNENNVPKFFYIHQPKGSPPEIQKYPGVSPTGPLPHLVNFPLLREQSSKKFKAIITGDTQVYTDKEIEYLRDSFVKEVSGSDASFVLCMGDNIGDHLDLYPRFLKVMSNIGKPIYLVPGNHDANLADAPDTAHSFETFKAQFGPTYYSFNYGDVHFVVLNDIVYPSPLDPTTRTYHGEIDAKQMEWLANDLKHVPADHLIVLSMHIPVVSDVDRLASKHNVANREALYELLNGRKVVSLGGHTHTVAHFQSGEEQEGWGQPTPFPQVIVGASCGSWWSGDFDNNGVPMSYQRDGAPRGYMVWDFNGNDYNDQFRASGKDPSEQMHLSFLTPSWQDWYSKMSEFTAQSLPRSGNPPVTLNDLPDQGTIPVADLAKTTLVANVWNGSRDSIVSCSFDGRTSMPAEKNLGIGDPYAQRLQSYVFRYAMGFEMFATPISAPGTPPQPADSWMLTNESFHVWTCPVPTDLEPGLHDVVVSTTDVNGNNYKQRMVFEVTE
jgi:3',5'-cyclic AMP phosphodiesterase CpdA